MIHNHDSDVYAAKFANLEQPDVDTNLLASIAKTSGSLEGTGAVGTYFYTAPEIVQGWPHIDEKVTFLICSFYILVFLLFQRCMLVYTLTDEKHFHCV